MTELKYTYKTEKHTLLIKLEQIVYIREEIIPGCCCGRYYYVRFVGCENEKSIREELYKELKKALEEKIS